MTNLVKKDTPHFLDNALLWGWMQWPLQKEPFLCKPLFLAVANAKTGVFR
jgi:hypothetical protein